MHMRFPLTFALASALAPLALPSQTNELLRAPQADFIYITVKPTGSATPFDYTVDRRASGEWSKPLKSGMLIRTRQRDGVNAVLEFVNPMTHSWSVSDSSVDAGVAKATASFLTAVTAQFGAIGGVTATTVQASPADTTTKRNGGTSPAVNYSKFVGGSNALLTWRQWLADGRGACFVDKAQSRIDTQTSLVEKGLYGTVKKNSKDDDIQSAEDYRNALFSVVEVLRSAPSMNVLREAVVAASKAVAQMEAADNSMRDAVLTVNAQLQGAFKDSSTIRLEKQGPKPSASTTTQTAIPGAKDTASNAPVTTVSADDIVKLINSRVNDATQSELSKQLATALQKIAEKTSQAEISALIVNCESFQRYTVATIQALTADANDVLIKRSSVARELRALVTAISQLLSTVRATDNDFSLGTFLPSESSDRMVCVDVKRRDVATDNDKVTVTDKSALRSCMRISRSRGFAVDVAPGVVYSNVRYARFGTSAGTVVKASDEVQHAVPAIMLNILPYATDGKVIGQVGVGSAKEYPAILVGGGLRFTSGIDWSLTVGAIWSWDRYLKKLKIGDAVSGTADIESDTGFELRQRPGFYIGLQIGIP